MNTILAISIEGGYAGREQQLADTLAVVGFLGGWRKQGVPPTRYLVAGAEGHRFVQVSLPVRPSAQSIAACAGVLGQQCIAALHDGDQLWRLIYRDGAASMGGDLVEYPVLVNVGAPA